MKQGGNSYTQVYKGGKVTYILDMEWVDGCTLQASQDPNDLMPNDASIDWAWFSIMLTRIVSLVVPFLDLSGLVMGKTVS